MSTEKLTKKLPITPKQCKAARDMLGWTQENLSEKSEIGESTIADFERGFRTPFARTLRDIKNTFEKAGIEFINEDRVVGLKHFLDK
ncbi:MAG: transcriptional regulator with XRE-family HTH domain [Rickettsiales bacterium]|jgi:transcriptional regulator with XRE-family HTH domain